MCGISGIVSTRKGEHDYLVNSARVSLAHRGPDNFSFLSLAGETVTLAHNRLSIVDNDSNSNQPFQTPSGVLVFNGEIYNYLQLRSEILDSLCLHASKVFVTESDTEVLAHGLSLYGSSFVQRLDGMYAFAWYDKNSGHLTLAADLFGVKSIYYYASSDVFVFSSEFEFICDVVGALGYGLSVDETSLEFTYAFLAPCIGSTLFTEVRRLLPGQLLSISPGFPNSHITVNQLSVPEAVSAYIPARGIPASKKFFSSYTIQDLILQASRSEARAATLFSGGIDSSVIAQAISSSSQSINHSLLFARHLSSPEGFVSDYPYAKCASESLGLPIVSRECPELDWHSFCSLSDLASCPGDLTAALPLSSLCSLANSSGIKVLLSGLGADEIFSGYRQHQLLALKSILNRKSALFLSRILRFVSVGQLFPLAIKRRLLLASELIVLDPVESTLSSMLWGCPGDYSMLRRFKSLLIERCASVGIRLEAKSVYSARLLFFFHFLASTHLPITDAVSMRYSVELRPVFLLKAFVEEFFGSPISFFGLWVTKIPLRRYLLRVFPLGYVFRPKTGFGAEASSLDSDLIDRLLGIVISSDCIPSSLKNRVVAEIEAVSVSSRPVYGLISLAHSLRLIARIRGHSVRC